MHAMHSFPLELPLSQEDLSDWPKAVYRHSFAFSVGDVAPQSKRIRQQTRCVHPLLAVRINRRRHDRTGDIRRRIHQHYYQPYRCRLPGVTPCRFLGVVCLDCEFRIAVCRKLASVTRPGPTFCNSWTRVTRHPIAIEHDVVFRGREWVRYSVKAEYQYRYRNELSSESSDVTLECLDPTYIARI